MAPDALLEAQKVIIIGNYSIEFADLRKAIS